MLKLFQAVGLALLLATFAACGSNGDDACDGINCADGFSCFIQDSGPACVPN